MPNPIFGQIWAQKFKVVCFLWKLVHIVSQGWWFWIQTRNFDLKIHFWANLGLNIQSCLFHLKVGAWGISRMLIPNGNLDFWNFDPKFHFLANLGPKSQSCLFCLRIDTHSISRMQVPNPDLDFWNFDLKFGPKKSVFRFVWKLVHMVSQGCWFWYQH